MTETTSHQNETQPDIVPVSHWHGTEYRGEEPAGERFLMEVVDKRKQSGQLRVAHALTEQIPGIVADLTAIDSRVYWVQEHQGRACLCSGSISKDDDPRDDVRLLEDIEGLSATELQEIAHNLDKWLSSPVFWHLGTEILDTAFRDVYGAST